MAVADLVQALPTAAADSTAAATAAKNATGSGTTMPAEGAKKKTRRGKRGGGGAVRNNNSNDINKTTTSTSNIDKDASEIIPAESHQATINDQQDQEDNRQEQQQQQQPEASTVKQTKSKARRGKRGGASKAKNNDSNMKNRKESNTESYEEQQDDEEYQEEIQVDETQDMVMDESEAAYKEPKDKSKYYTDNGDDTNKESEYIHIKKGLDTSDYEQTDFGLVPPDTFTYFTTFVDPILDESFGIVVDAGDEKDKKKKKKKKDDNGNEPLAVIPAANLPQFETDEEREIFISNVYQEVGHHDVKLAGDTACSRVLEKLIAVSTDWQVRRLLSHFSGMFTLLLRHRFASHVLQALLNQAAGIIEREIRYGPAPTPADESTTETIPPMQDLIISLCEEVSLQFVPLMTDPWGSHLLRLILGLLNGDDVSVLTASLSSIRSKKSKEFHGKDDGDKNKKLRARVVPESFKRVLDTIINGVLNGLDSYEIRNLAVHVVANPVLQILVAIKGAGEKIVDLVMSIDEERDDDSLPSFMDMLIRDKVGSHLVEKILATASPTQFHTLYIRHFRNKLAQLSADGVANFVVQHLFQNTKNGTQVTVLADELIGNGNGLGNLLFRGRSGVVLKVVEVCGKFGVYQKEVVKAICSAVGVATPDEKKKLLPLILYNVSLENYTNRTRLFFNYQGAMIIEALLSFAEEYSKLIIDSFMSLPTTETYSWIFDPIASRVYEHILKHPNVPLKAKRKILFGLAGKFTELACDKFGSRFVDTCWSVADISMKESIASELVASYSTLTANFHAKFVVRNCRIEAFKRRKEEWVEKEKGIERKKDMFKEFALDADEKAHDHHKGEVKVKSAEFNGDGVEEDPLWKTTKYDDTMASLGFGKSTSTSTAGAKAGDKKGKKQKSSSKAKGDDGSNLLIDKEDATKADSAGTGYAMDDIDAVFKKGKKGGLQNDSHVEQPNQQTEEESETEKPSKDDSDSSDSDSDEDEKRSKKRKQKKNDAADVSMVLDALAATTKKRKKSKSLAAAGAVDKTVKKRKFES